MRTTIPSSLLSTGHTVWVSKIGGVYYVELEGDIETMPLIPDDELNEYCKRHGFKCTWEMAGPTSYKCVRRGEIR